MASGTTLHADETSARNKKSLSRYLSTAARILMGLLFFVTGLNGFLNFLPQPKSPMPDAAVAFAGALMKTGYLFPLIHRDAVACGSAALIEPLRAACSCTDRADHHQHPRVPRLPGTIGASSRHHRSGPRALPHLGVPEGISSHAGDAGHAGQAMNWQVGGLFSVAQANA